MKQLFVLILLLLVNTAHISAQTMREAYLDYIAKYSGLAVDQQKRHKIPASIKLAQGLLESAAGLGELAQFSNNHFGIKCNDWAGEKVYSDDDTRDECFRKYKSVKESYEDHSMFLTSRPRYAELFTLQTTDYKGWAQGLKKAGYATDPNYANKLIKLIEDYGLNKYDAGTRIASSKNNAGNDTWQTVSSNTLKGHNVYRNNRTKCVFSEAGDTYASIAAEFEITETKILQYNDLTNPRELEPGTVVYIAPKRNKASNEFSNHIVKEGENMYRISQKYAIKLKTLYDLNNLPYDQGVYMNMILKLR